MPPIPHDFTGDRFARVVVLEEAASVFNSRGIRQRRMRCRCDCGRVFTTYAHSLRSGRTRSCGCLQRQLSVERLRTHGHGSPRAKTPEYRAWLHMKDRCRPDYEDRRNYADRGITVCEQWLNSFETFFADVGHRPSPKHTLDRINNDGPYSPENCRWATRYQQMRNTRETHLLTHGGETLSVTEWAERCGVVPNSILSRLKWGWPIGRAVTAPNQRQ